MNFQSPFPHQSKLPCRQFGTDLPAIVLQWKVAVGPLRAGAASTHNNAEIQLHVHCGDFVLALRVSCHCRTNLHGPKF